MPTDNFIQKSYADRTRIQSFAFVIAVFVGVLFGGSSFFLSLADSGQLCEIELDSCINPNDAPVASLVRLPGIGIGRAKAIVSYRNNFTEKAGNSRAFRNHDDLQKVKGIGPKTVQNISQWLKF